MRCDMAQDMMVDYLRGELPAEDRTRLENHLANCPECSRQLEGSKRVLAIAEETGEPAVVDLVEKMIAEAITQKASDIHVEPGDDETIVRLRIDGVLKELGRYPKALLEPLCARVKYLAEGDYGTAREFSQPWTGRMLHHVPPREYNLRCSYVPAVRGPSLVIRILDKNSALVPMENLGLCDADLARVRDLMHLPNGLILITGPVGSGRTTLAYHLLREAAQNPGCKVLTVENPVEMLLPNMVQIPARPKEGLGHAVLLRHVMRQDPDVIFCGDIPDLDTADALIGAALTGHLVITIMSSPDAVSAIARLAQVVRKPDVDLVAETVRGVIAMRVARRVCNSCAESCTPPASELALLSAMIGREVPATTQLRQGHGCEKCRQTGYSGRIGIFEVLTLDAAMADLIRANTTKEALRDAAVKAGFASLDQDAADKVIEGVTTIQEIRRAVRAAD